VPERVFAAAPLRATQLLEELQLYSLQMRQLYAKSVCKLPSKNPSLLYSRKNKEETHLPTWSGVYVFVPHVNVSPAAVR
jgi:hypothetical protein